MIGFWATLVCPRVEEYPDLIKTYLQYLSRDFDFVSVSVNYPDEKAAVLKFFQKEHSAVRNLQFGSGRAHAELITIQPKDRPDRAAATLRHRS